jgi:hypothetical protein
MQIKTNQQISQVWDVLKSSPAHQRFNADMVATLPATVESYFKAQIRALHIMMNY